MSEGEIAQTVRGGQASRVVPFPGTLPTPAPNPSPGPAARQVTFNRDELSRILNLYGRMVAQGEWRDYAIAFEREKATFSIYRRTSEMPLYRVEKDPKLARRQGAYAVVAATGHVMKRGHDLARVLAVLEKPLRAV
jgi:hypothetical protein